MSKKYTRKATFTTEDKNGTTYYRAVNKPAQRLVKATGKRKLVTLAQLRKVYNPSLSYVPYTYKVAGNHDAGFKKVRV